MEISTIAFDYYDGLSEGITLSLIGNANYYFKLLAWDEDQDQRLYFLAEAKKSDFNDILVALSKDQEVPQSGTWLAQWKFASRDDEKMVITKLENFWSGTSSYVALGDSVHDNSLKCFEIGPTLTDRVTKALSSENVDDLANWLPLLKQEL